MIFSKENFHLNAKIYQKTLKRRKTRASRIKPLLPFNQIAKVFHSTISISANFENNPLKL